MTENVFSYIVSSKDRWNGDGKAYFYVKKKQNLYMVHLAHIC